MRRTRAAYHYAVRDIEKNTQNIVRQKFAEAVLQNNDRNLWKEVHKIQGKRSCYGSSVDDCYTDGNIADLFYKKYEDLYIPVCHTILMIWMPSSWNLKHQLMAIVVIL